MRRLVATLSLLALIGALLGSLNLIFFIHLPYGEGEETTVTVEPGLNLGQVIDLLSREGLISNRPLFKAYVVLENAGGRVRAGEYRFPRPVTPKQLLALLLSGDFARRRITLPEGWTAREIATYLETLGVIPAAPFLEKVTDPDYSRTLGFPYSSLEGFLFPDTYEIYQPKGAEEVIEKLVGRFREVYQTEFQARARERGMTDYEVVTLASIVEKETGRADERPLIASVFLNRLARGMGLDSDPTVIYGIPNFSGNLIRADLERPGPYNTYLNAGLPPTPIANPGRESIRAVLFPAETDYLYFVSRNDGSHEFSRTLEEHGRAVYRYQVSPQARPDPTSR